MELTPWSKSWSVYTCWFADSAVQFIPPVSTFLFPRYAHHPLLSLFTDIARVLQFAISLSPCLYPNFTDVQFAIAEANVNLQPLDMRSKEIFRKVRAFNKKKNLEANRAEKAAATADADAVAEAPTTEGAAEVADSEAESTEGSVVSEDETADESGADKQSGDGVAEGAGKDVSEDGDRR